MTKKLALLSMLAMFLPVSVIAAEAGREDCSQYSTAPGQAISVEMLRCSINNQRLDTEEKRAQLEAEAASAVADSPTHGESSYQRCILKSAPGAQNDLAARTVSNECSKYPRYLRAPESDFWGYSTAAQCFKDLGSKTGSNIAAMLIARSCQELFPGQSLAQ